MEYHSQLFSESAVLYYGKLSFDTLPMGAPGDSDNAKINRQPTKKTVVNEGPARNRHVNERSGNR